MEHTRTLRRCSVRLRKRLPRLESRPSRCRSSSSRRLSTQTSLNPFQILFVWIRKFLKSFQLCKHTASGFVRQLRCLHTKLPSLAKPLRFKRTLSRNWFFRLIPLIRRMDASSPRSARLTRSSVNRVNVYGKSFQTQKVSSNETCLQEAKALTLRLFAKGSLAKSESDCWQSEFITSEFTSNAAHWFSSNTSNFWWNSKLIRRICF